ncbi:MAG: excinuclease ABC subunit UvrC [Desulfobacteraceae bacterium]|nr:excinuclease ABC subunit UvrC [Desulfobacteraceae bacterium]MBC2752702.1 excinuclease ABC subunit UvrC [Desulfobacteraceae bacterium]
MTPSPDNIRPDLKEKVRQAETAPGVYLMKDTAGRILYVGKAKNLKRRLASYFLKTGASDIKTRTLLQRVIDFDTIVTGSEKEALLLESNLIKRHRPRYNVILKDDKRYPVLRIDLNHPYPNLSIVRKIGKDGAAYFGPFASALAVRETLKFINKYFRLRKCKNREFSQRTRPCLHYQMDACYGPCCLEVAPSFYRKIVDEVILFLKGRTPELIRKIRNEMETAVQKLAFEEAAQLRDRMQAMEMTLEKQRAVTKDLRDRDVITIAAGDQLVMVNVLSIRAGYLQGSRNFRITETLADQAELLSTFIRQLYPPGAQCPHEILTPVVPADAPLLEDWFQSEHAQSVKLFHPQRGEKKQLLEMGHQNAEKALREWMADQRQRQTLLESVGKRLRLIKIPRRIECFDNSNLFGQSPVAGMVVFEDGRPCRSQYRKFAIRTVGKPDDYAAMEEILQRRFSRHPEWPFPDILLLDGGKGQLNIAVDVIHRLGIEGRFALAAIAKKEVDRGELRDKIYIPNRANPVSFANDEAALLFLQRIRDEAHRFAISFHRQKRKKKAFASDLDGIPGIGPIRKQTLLRHFGSLNAIRAATLEELSALPGMNRKTAEALFHRLASGRE